VATTLFKFDFASFLKVGWFTAVTLIITFCIIDMFDTIGTVVGTASRAGMLDKEGNVPQMKEILTADAVGTMVGAVCGTSTVTTFVEASSGVAVGGRTGFAAVVTAVFFFIAMFLSPVAALIPAAAYAAALIYVGILMIGCVKDIDWSDAAIAVPSFLTITMMPFTYNISYGIAFGLISYIAIKLFTGKAKEINAGTWVIAILFALMFFLTH